MSAIIVDGKALAKRIEGLLGQRVEKLVEQGRRAPCLAVVLVGEDPASQVYVKSKTKRAKRCGISTKDFRFPATVSDVELQQKLRTLSLDPEVDGILLQLPLPNGLDEFSAICSIDPGCDVDGLHPLNQGLLLRGAPAPIPCTPLGVMRLIDQAVSELGGPEDLKGLNAVVVGRSVLVGKPMGLLLLERNCTVTYCHSRTRDLAAICAKADILVAAVGRAELLKAEHVKPGAVVIDVGINRLDDGRLVGDVDFEQAASSAGAITPVPGGAGPMTIAMLLENTVNAAEKNPSL